MSATKPFFISSKEISLFDSMNEELIDEFVGQSVDIYKINTQHTKDTHNTQQQPPEPQKNNK